MKDSISCPICHSVGFSNFLTCTDFTVSRETFSVLECTNCNFKLTAPVPKNIADYYQSDDYISHTSAGSSLINKIYIFARRFTLNWKYRIVTRYSNISAPSMLDFGCGTGEFLKKCQDKNLQVAGVEPSDKARNLALAKLNQTVVSNLNELPHPEYDTITLWHVLEHLPDLNNTLEQLKNKLSRSGTMFIAVPNHRSEDANNYQQYWAGYDVPRHLWHFTQTNMQTLIKNHGLNLIAKIPMKLDAYYISLMSEKNRRNGELSPFRFLHAIYIALTSNLQAKKTTDYSSIIYIIRK